MHTTEQDARVEYGRGGLHCIEAVVSGKGFAPHRHDTYTFALTLEGVQSFNYRGSRRHSLPGGAVVLHPDELHDGQASTDEGFRYRSIHLAPALLQSVLGGHELPFVEGGTSSDPGLLHAIHSLLGDYERPLGALEFQDVLYDLAVRLRELGRNSRPHARVDARAAEVARRYLVEQRDEAVTLEALEAATGQDRWKLSRDFRAMFGTSPYRYLLMRRLERARELLATGHAPADVAARCHFSDQSHLTRQFRGAFGITPKRWASANAARRGRTIVL